MERFVNHILYAIHMFTRNFEPAIYENGRISYGGLVAGKVFLIMTMNYLWAIFFTVMQLLGRDIAEPLFRTHLFEVAYLVVIIIIANVLRYIWFLKDNKEEKYYWEFASMPDDVHLKWRFAAWGLFLFSIVYLLICICL